MIDPSLYRIPRRLPVFFLLDTSETMAGTLEVTMRQGLLVVRNELQRHTLSARSVNLGVITFAEACRYTQLASLSLFTPPIWQTRGRCHIGPALSCLAEALTFDLVISQPERPGDYAPLVFLVLGALPVDAWQMGQNMLRSFTDNRRPHIVALVTQRDLVEKAKQLDQLVLLLDPARGESMTNFFYWVAQATTRICEDCESGATSIEFPQLPYGVVMPG